MTSTSMSPTRCQIYATYFSQSMVALARFPKEGVGLSRFCV